MKTLQLALVALLLVFATACHTHNADSPANSGPDDTTTDRMSNDTNKYSHEASPSLAPVDTSHKMDSNRGNTQQQ